MTKTRKFTDLVQINKSTTCKSCRTYDYRLPLPITKDLADYLSVLGKLKYPTSRTNIIRIENEYVSLRCLAGTNQIKIKYLKDPDNQTKIAEMQIAAYLEEVMEIPVSYE